jgi:hypothetical protein
MLLPLSSLDAGVPAEDSGHGVRRKDESGQALPDLLGEASGWRATMPATAAFLRVSLMEAAISSFRRGDI